MELKMSDLKSKLPDLKELGEIGSKLYKDIKTSVCEIISGYKKKHPSTEPHAKTTKKTSSAVKSKSAKKDKE